MALFHYKLIIIDSYKYVVIFDTILGAFAALFLSFWSLKMTEKHDKIYITYPNSKNLKNAYSFVKIHDF